MLFSLLFFPILVASPELNILISAFFFSYILIFDFNYKYSKTIINVLIPLIFILLIALISSFFYSNTIIDAVKDFLLLLKPVLYIVLGFYFTSKIKEKAFIFDLLIYIAAFFAIIHIVKVTFYLVDNPFAVNRVRYIGGKDNIIELFALIVLFSGIRQKVFYKKTKYYKFFKTIIIISFFLYFSRTMLVTGLIFLLAIKGYTKLTRKGIMYISFFIISALAFYSYLNSIEIERGSSGIEGLMYKIKLAPAEIFLTQIDIKDHAKLWDHWRGYEALKAYEQLTDTPFGMGLLFGKGTGSLVDLEFVAPLNEAGMQYISTLHNGYAFILFKSGIIGLVCYLVFLFNIYIQAYKKDKNKILINNFISGIAIYYAFSTLVITGIYNKVEVLAIVLGSFLYLSSNKYKTINESRNFRN